MLSIHYEKDFLSDSLAVFEPTRSKQANSPTDRRLALTGLFPGLKKCPPDTFLPRCARPPSSSPPSIPKRTAPRRVLSFLVRIVGLEPTRRWHRNLNPTRLPIPSYPLIVIIYLSSCCCARCAPCCRCSCVAHRPQPLAQVAPPAIGGAPIAPQFHHIRIFS